MKKPRKRLGGPAQKPTAVPKLKGRGQKQTPLLPAKGKGKNLKIKDKPELKGMGYAKDLSQVTPKRPEPDNMPPKRRSAAVTPTTKAGNIVQHGSKAEKKLRDIRI